MNNEYTYTRRDGSQYTIKVQGHKLLIRQCAQQQKNWLVGDSDKPIPALARAMLESWSKETPSGVYHILAIGPKVGEMRPREFWSRYKSCTYVSGNRDWDGDVGDFVIIPTISHMNGLWFRDVAPEGHAMRDVDFLIDECIVQAVIPDS